jgi:hypothetical protein
MKATKSRIKEEFPDEFVDIFAHLKQSISSFDAIRACVEEWFPTALVTAAIYHTWQFKFSPQRKDPCEQMVSRAATLPTRSSKTYMNQAMYSSVHSVTKCRDFVLSDGMH